MSLIKCPECGENVSDKAEKCPHCGYKINGTVEEKKTDERKCEKCGTVLDTDQDFCPKCGSEFGTKTCMNCGSKLGENQDYCSKCGTEYGKKKCKKCGELFEGKKKCCEKCEKKKKKRLLIPACILGCIFISLIVFGLVRSGGSVVRLYKIISEGHYSCFTAHNYIEPNCQHGYLCSECGYEKGECGDHTWAAATCQKPETCTVCGEQRGDVIAHNYLPATCTKPSTCSMCGGTTGSALGHTTRLGKCSRCGETIKDLVDEYLEIATYMQLARDSIVSSAEYFNAGSTYLSYYEIQYAIAYIDLAISYCGNYDEFKECKSYLTEANRYFNQVQNNFNSVKTYATMGKDEFNKAYGSLDEYLLVPFYD